MKKRKITLLSGKGWSLLFQCNERGSIENRGIFNIRELTGWVVRKHRSKEYWREYAKKWKQNKRKDPKFVIIEREISRISNENNRERQRAHGRKNFYLHRDKFIARRDRRQRDLGHHLIGFPPKNKEQFHHINKNDVVAIGEYVHMHVYHICGDGKLEGMIG